MTTYAAVERLHRGTVEGLSPGNVWWLLGWVADVAAHAADFKLAPVGWRIERDGGEATGCRLVCDEPPYRAGDYAVLFEWPMVRAGR